MISLQKMMSKDDALFDLLQASAEEGAVSVQALKRILANPSITPTLDDFVASRRKDNAITNEIGELLVRTFVTSIEREDIEELSNALYKIPKTIEKFAERYVITAPMVRDADFTKQIAMLEEATAIVLTIVKELKRSSIRNIAAQNAKLQTLESAADDLLLESLRVLYSGQYGPMQAIALKDLHELLERVFDRCRDAGNIISRIALKNS